MDSPSQQSADTMTRLAYFLCRGSSVHASRDAVTLMAVDLVLFSAKNFRLDQPPRIRDKFYFRSGPTPSRQTNHVAQCRLDAPQ
jgi:hypothetical protein